MPVEIVTTSEAWVHLRESAINDSQIEFKVLAATAILLSYLKVTEDTLPDTWYTEDSPPVLDVPDDIKAACLLMLGELWDKRDGTCDPLTGTVTALLDRHRDPTLA